MGLVDEYLEDFEYPYDGNSVVIYLPLNIYLSNCKRWR